MNMQMGEMGMKMVVLQKTDSPNLVYHINDAKKTYTEIDLTKIREMASQQPDTRKYTVEKLGQETILGYKTQHVLVQEQAAGDGKGMTTEMWTAKDLLDYATFARMQARHGQEGWRGGFGQSAERSRRRRPAAEIHQHNPGRHQDYDGGCES